MTFDALTVAAVRDELETKLRGGRVQRVLMTGERTLSMELYAHGRRQFLLCSADPLSARVCLTAEPPVRGVETPTPFLLLLRKHVRDGRITAIEQPALERVLRLRITKRDKENTLSEIALIIETMGRRSNVLLVGQDGCILEALRRVGPTRNPRRPVLPGRPYAPPPPQDRLNPHEAGSFESLARSSREARSKPLEELLAARLEGFSPLAAREAAFRAGGLGVPAAEANWTRVKAAIDDLLAPLSTGDWDPTVASQGGRVVAFAPYPFSHLAAAGAELRHLPSISQAVELGFGEQARPRAAPVENRALLAAIDRLQQQARRKRAALERSLEAAGQASVLRQAGEAILANLASIAPGQASFSLDGLEIQVEPRLSPVENAQRMFRDYRKARHAAEQIPALLEATELRLRHLEELRALAEVADTQQRRRALQEDLAELTHESQRRQEARKTGRADGAGARGEKGVLRHRTPDGLEVLVGTSSRGNETATFRLAKPDDLWLHARDVPGAHVILKSSGREPPPSSLIYAARLAARNSGARDAGRAEVDCTLRKHVRRVPGAPPGLVSYRAEKTIAVETDGS